MGDNSAAIHSQSPTIDIPPELFETIHMQFPQKKYLKEYCEITNSKGHSTIHRTNNNSKD